MVRNTKFIDPGDCPSLGPGLDLPPYALPFRQKDLVMWLMAQPRLVEPSDTEYVVVEDEPEPPQPSPPAVELPVLASAPPMELGGEPIKMCAAEPLLVLPCIPATASIEELSEHLGKLALVTARAEEERRQTLRLMDNQLLREVEELRHDNLELKARNEFLEAEVDRLRDGKRPKIRVVGDLERTTTTIALALRPWEKFTQVYRLYGEDVRLLDLDGRDTLMSCEKL